MRIFYSFIILVLSVILILMPVTDGVYDFKTDVREDRLPATTAAAITSANVTLQKSVYDDDATTISVFSSLSSDVPVLSSYHAPTHSANVTGLAASSTRTLTVSYDVDAINMAGLSTFLDLLSFIWIILWIAFPIAGIAAIWLGKE